MLFRSGTFSQTCIYFQGFLGLRKISAQGKYWKNSTLFVKLNGIRVHSRKDSVAEGLNAFGENEFLEELEC